MGASRARRTMLMSVLSDASLSISKAKVLHGSTVRFEGRTKRVSLGILEPCGCSAFPIFERSDSGLGVARPSQARLRPTALWTATMREGRPNLRTQPDLLHAVEGGILTGRLVSYIL